MGARPAAVGVRGDVLAVHRRGRLLVVARIARSRIRAPKRRCSSSMAPSSSRSRASRTSSNPGDTPTCPPAAPGRCTTARPGRRRFTGSARRTSRVAGLDAPEPVIANEREIEPVAMPDTDGAWATTRFVDPGRSAPRHARHDRDPAARRVDPVRRDARDGARPLRAAGQGGVPAQPGLGGGGGRRLHVAARLLPAGVLRGGAGTRSATCSTRTSIATRRSSRQFDLRRPAAIPHHRKRFPISLPAARGEVYNQPGLAEGVCMNHDTPRRRRPSHRESVEKDGETVAAEVRINGRRYAAWATLRCGPRRLTSCASRASPAARRAAPRVSAAPVRSWSRGRG